MRHERRDPNQQMNQQLQVYLNEQAQAADDDLRQAVEACGGDVASALRCALIANAFLMEENKRLRVQVSRGFQRKK
jgi:hypothetical protein